MIKFFPLLCSLVCLAQAEDSAVCMNGDTVSWTGISGVTYEIWHSTDLDGWTNSNLTRTGVGTLSFNVSDVFSSPLPAKAFFQLRWDTFVDSDGDLIDDSYEMLLVNANSSDAITTIQEFLPSDDFDNDGIKNYDEYRYGLDSQVDDASVSSSQLTYSYQLSRLVSLTVGGTARATFSYDKNQNLISVGQ